MPASKSNDIDYVLPDERHRPRKGKKAPKAQPLPEFDAMKIPDQPGHAKLPASCKSAYDIFSLFFPDDLLETLAKNTNQNANKHRVGPRQPVAHPWKDTTAEELKAFLAVWILVGLYPIPRMNQYWNEKNDMRPTFGMIRRRISRDRWHKIDRYFHISPPPMRRPPPKAVLLQNSAHWMSNCETYPGNTGKQAEILLLTKQ